MVKLAPLATAKTGQAMTIKGTNVITFTDVLVGEVWLCSGQSNMADSFIPNKGKQIDPKDLETDLSGIRFYTPGFRKPGTGEWNAVEARTQGRLTRVGFYFGFRLYRELGVPIGLIQAYNSATTIQAWMPQDVAETIRVKLGIPPDWNETLPVSKAAVQFEDKIAPILPVTFRGVIWYQGERNAKTYTGWEYRELLSCLIDTWRRLWAERAGLELRKFPFYYVQVPCQEVRSDEEWPWVRDAMRRVLQVTANTGMAVFYEYGPSLHPEEKEPAGQRLALWALARDYGRSGLVYSGPLLDQISFQGDQVVLSFKHVGGGLRSKSGGNQLKFFELAGEDGRYVPATAFIAGDKVLVRAPEIRRPVYVRYLFRKSPPDPEISLINAEGLPASSFISDDFKPLRTTKHAPTKD
jgi:hypothetical protein